MYTVLCNKIKTFKKRKLIKQQNEASLYLGSIGYESVLSELEEFECYLDNVAGDSSKSEKNSLKTGNFEEDLYNSIKMNQDGVNISGDGKGYSISLKILLYICKHHATTKKRFFVYIMTYATIITDDQFAEICRIFGYDLSETLYFAEEIREKGGKIVKESDKEKEQRNLCYLRSLFLENKIQSLKYEEDNTRCQAEIDKLKRYRKMLEQKNKNLKIRNFGVPRSIVSEVLKCTVYTVQMSCYFIRNILKYCNEKETEMLEEEKTKRTQSVLYNASFSYSAQDYSVSYKTGFFSSTGKKESESSGSGYSALLLQWAKRKKKENNYPEQRANPIKEEKSHTKQNGNRVKEQKKVGYSKYGVGAELFKKVERSKWKKEKSLFSDVFYPHSVFFEGMRNVPEK